MQIFGKVYQLTFRRKLIKRGNNVVWLKGAKSFHVVVHCMSTKTNWYRHVFSGLQWSVYNRTFTCFYGQYQVTK